MSIKPVSHYEITSQIISRIQQDFESLVHNYNDLMFEQSSEKALSDIQSLNDILLNLKSELEPITNQALQLEYLNKNQEKIFKLNNELGTMMHELLRLRDSMSIMREKTGDLAKDPNENEKLSIVDVMMKINGTWTVKVKSPEDTGGNFRKVRIIEANTKEEICEIGMIEPGNEVKVNSKIPLAFKMCLQAVSDNRIISDIYVVLRIKILKVKIICNEMIEISLKNTTDEVIQGATIEYGQHVLFDQVNLDPNQIESFTTKSELDRYHYFVVNYQGENASHPVVHPLYYLDMPIEVTEKDLNNKQRALLREAKDYKDNIEVAILKYRILTRNAESYQNLLN